MDRYVERGQDECPGVGTEVDAALNWVGDHTFVLRRPSFLNMHLAIFYVISAISKIIDGSMDEREKPKYK